MKVVEMNIKDFWPSFRAWLVIQFPHRVETEINYTPSGGDRSKIVLVDSPVFVAGVYDTSRTVAIQAEETFLGLFDYTEESSFEELCREIYNRLFDLQVKEISHTTDPLNRFFLYTINFRTYLKEPFKIYCYARHAVMPAEEKKSEKSCSCCGKDMIVKVQEAIMKGGELGPSPRGFGIKPFTLARAIEIAASVHTGDDKAGMPYILHCTRVMNRMHTIYGKMAGVLHDTIEDGYLTAEQLREYGCPEPVLRAVINCTKLPEEEGSEEGYNNFITRIIETGDQLSIELKISDVTDNLDPARIQYLPEERRQRNISRYTKALARLIKGK